MAKASRTMTALVFACLLCSALGGAPASAVPLNADYRAEYVDLNPGGLAYEVNLDHEGKLWVSDCEAGEIRMYDPNGNYFNIITFNNQPNICPSDARRDLANNVWFVNGVSTADWQIARLNGGDWSSMDYWSVDGGASTTYSMVGTAIDDYGNLWISDWSNASVYRFNHNPLSGENTFTEFPFPDKPGGHPAGTSNYVLALGSDEIWVADSDNNDILCLHPSGDYFERWDILNPGGQDGYPTELAADIFGNIWWVDYYNASLGRLIPRDNLVTLFELDVDNYASPYGISALSTDIWYTDQFAPAVGRLNPLHPQADETETSTVDYEADLKVLPVSSLDPNGPVVTSHSGEATVDPIEGIPWRPEPEYAGVLMPNESWSAWRLPCESEIDCSPSPYGIADAGRWAYFTDQGRQRLVRITDKLNLIHLPVVLRR